MQADGTFSASETLPYQGVNTIVASIVDTYGNEGSSAPIVDTLDTVTPTVVLTNAGVAGAASTQTIAGTVTSGGSAAVVGQLVTLTDNGQALGTTTVQADGTFSASETLLNQGANNIVAYVVDSYGNEGSSAPIVSSDGII